jgi:hypothetical protein
MLNGEQFADLDLDISERVLLNVFFPLITRRSSTRRGPRRFRPGKKPLIDDHCKSSSQNRTSRMFHLYRE